MADKRPKVLTLEEAADYLRVHPSTMYRMVKKGAVPAFKIGTDWRFNVDQLDKWMLEQSFRDPRGGGRARPGGR